MPAFKKRILIAIFYIANSRRLFLNIVILRELNGLNYTEKQCVVTMYQTDIDIISVQAWCRKLISDKQVVGIKPLDSK